MGVKIRQKDGKWYVFINHHGRRKAKCIGDSNRVLYPQVTEKSGAAACGQIVSLSCREKGTVLWHPIRCFPNSCGGEAGARPAG
jgi:hypothetical protein